VIQFWARVTIISDITKRGNPETIIIAIDDDSRNIWWKLVRHLLLASQKYQRKLYYLLIWLELHWYEKVFALPLCFRLWMDLLKKWIYFSVITGFYIKGNFSMSLAKIMSIWENLKKHWWHYDFKKYLKSKNIDILTIHT